MSVLDDILSVKTKERTKLKAQVKQLDTEIAGLKMSIKAEVSARKGQATATRKRRKATIKK